MAVLFPLKVLDVFASVLPPTSNFLLTQLQKFHVLQPRNPVLVARYVAISLLLINAHLFNFYQALLPLSLSLSLSPLPSSFPPSPYPVPPTRAEGII